MGKGCKQPMVTQESAGEINAPISLFLFSPSSLLMTAWAAKHESRFIGAFGVSLVAQSVKKICLWCRRPRFSSWVRKIPWRRKGQPTPVFLPGEFHGQGSLVGYGPWGRKSWTWLGDQMTTTMGFIGVLNLWPRCVTTFYVEEEKQILGCVGHIQSLLFLSFFHDSLKI